MVWHLATLMACFPRVDGAGEGVEDSDAVVDGTDTADDTADTDGTGGDTAAPTDPPRLDGVSPTDGTDAGGQQVVLAGANLGRGTRAWFGDEEAEVLDLDGGDLVVRTPAGSIGTVDVTVANDAHEDTLTDAFTYWPDATDQTVAMAAWYYSEDQSGYGYNGVDAAVWPVQPADVALWELFGEMDRCSGSSAAVAETWDGEFWLTDQDDGTWPLTWEDDAFRGSWSPSAWTQVDTLGMGATAGSDGPGWSVDPFFSPPGAFDVTAPELLYGTGVWIGGDLTVAWTGTPGDFMILQLAGQTSEMCVLEDDGAFVVDASEMPAADAWGTVRFTLGRFRVAETTRTFDNGVVIGAGATFTTGWLYTW